MTDAELFADKVIVLTGATGLIGRHLAPRLAALGARLRTASSRPPADGFPADLPNVEHFIGDLSDRNFADRLMAGADGLFHLATKRGSVGIQVKRAATMLADNIAMDFTSLEAARRAGVKRVLYSSTVTVYPPMEVYREDLVWSAPPHPGDQYAAWAKRMAEKLTEAWGVEYGFHDTVIVRPVNTFGPYDDFNPQTALVAPALIRRVLSGENPLSVWGDGSAVRDLIYVDDCVEGFLAAYRHGVGQGAFNLGSGRGYSVREIVTAVLNATGRSDLPVVWDASKPAGEARKVADVTRAREILGWTAAIPFEEGVRRTVEWFLSGKALRV